MLRQIAVLFAVAALSTFTLARAGVSDLSAKCDFSNDPRFRILAGKVPLSPAQVSKTPSLAEISNNAIPDPQEKAALLELNKLGTICANEAMAMAGGLSDQIQGFLRELRVAGLNQQRLLIEGKITYGQFRQNTYLLLARGQQVIGEYEQAERQAERQADAQRKAAAAAQLNSTMQLLQSFNRSPTVTNCDRFGSGITCTTR